MEGATKSGNTISDFVRKGWDTIVNFLSNFCKWILNALRSVFNKLATLFPDRVVESVRTFTTKVGEALKERFKNYTKDKVTGQWKEVVVEKNIDENEVPDDIKAMLAASTEVETTEKVVLELENAQSSAG